MNGLCGKLFVIDFSLYYVIFKRKGKLMGICFGFFR